MVIGYSFSTINSQSGWAVISTEMFWATTEARPSNSAANTAAA